MPGGLMNRCSVGKSVQHPSPSLYPEALLYNTVLCDWWKKWVRRIPSAMTCWSGNTVGHYCLSSWLCFLFWPDKFDCYKSKIFPIRKGFKKTKQNKQKKKKKTLLDTSVVRKCWVFSLKENWPKKTFCKSNQRKKMNSQERCFSCLSIVLLW